MDLVPVLPGMLKTELDQAGPDPVAPQLRRNPGVVEVPDSRSCFAVREFRFRSVHDSHEALFQGAVFDLHGRDDTTER